MAANVSRIWCFAFSTTSSGRAWPPASLIYVLSLAITGLISAANTPLGSAAAAIVHPARCRRLRRLRLPSLFARGMLAFRLRPIVLSPAIFVFDLAWGRKNLPLALRSHVLTRDSVKNDW